MDDIDLFDNDAGEVALLHAQGRVVIAYFSAGSWEDWRPDAGDFPESVKGNSNGWPGENWLDIRQLDILGPIMEARMDLAVQKGFDGVDPDNVDGYANNTGFNITYDDQITYNVFLANAAHQRGLSVSLKNDLGQVVDLEPYFDWALNEECYHYEECDKLLPFIAAGKAVMHIEYDSPTSAFCPWSNDYGFSSMKKRLDLDAWMDPCWWGNASRPYRGLLGVANRAETWYTILGSQAASTTQMVPNRWTAGVAGGVRHHCPSRRPFSGQASLHW
jgi:hypothetical protein